MIVDLFAGPGGWSEGLRMLGHRELGIEWDDAACKTAKAAGHARRKADVAALDPLEFGPFIDGLIASPPCQAWSMAGKGGGRRDVEHVIACALELAAGNDTRAEHAAKCEDARSMLVVEPLRWALALKPTWIACEQVPPVLELWTLFAQILEQHGYSTWAGVLEAERYGVPQTRERAVLMAHRDRPVHPPMPTHQRYVPGEPQRHDVTFDGEVLPWVSMAEALGWEEGPSPSPSPSVTGGGGETGGVEVFASKHARARAVAAVTVRTSPEGTGRQASPTFDAVRRPSRTVTGLDLSKGWTVENISGWGWNPRQNGGTVRDGHEPAPAVLADGLAKGVPVWDDERGCPKAGPNAVRVTVQEASILQSFRPDYPWQGSRSKQFQQVGNAVPPLLARAVLAELVEPAATQELAA